MKALRDLEADRPVKVDAVCPECGEIAERILKLSYVKNPQSHRIGGYLVRTCPKCEGQ